MNSINLQGPSAGYISGVVSAIVSDTADWLFSQLHEAENKGKFVDRIVSEVGFVSLATKGLGHGFS